MQSSSNESGPWRPRNFRSESSPSGDWTDSWRSFEAPEIGLIPGTVTLVVTPIPRSFTMLCCSNVNVMLSQETKGAVIISIFSRH